MTQSAARVVVVGGGVLGTSTAARPAQRGVDVTLLTEAGAVPGTAGPHVAVTHSGATLGLIAGELLAGEIVSGEEDRLPAPFRADRFTGG